MRTVDAAGLQIGDDQPPRIMGVLNVSSESPYKPSVFNSPDEAAEYVDRELIDEGADIVDIGLESANKKFEVLSADGELDRLDTAIETIKSVSGDAIFSIEKTASPETLSIVSRAVSRRSSSPSAESTSNFLLADSRPISTISAPSSINSRSTYSAASLGLLNTLGL